MAKRFFMACLAGLAFTAGAALDVTPLYADTRPWAVPVEPFRIVGPVHYVGTADIAVYAIRTSAGVIVVDGGLHQALPDLVASLRALGMDPKDVKVLLASHSHYDHAGGLAELKRMTGAMFVSSRGDADAYARGGLGDFAFGDRFPFPVVKADRIVADGDIVELGEVRMTAHVTPGHTQGCTTWTLRTREGNRDVDVVFGCSYTAPGYKLAPIAAYPGIVEDFRATFRKLEKLPCDVRLASHASAFAMAERRARQVKGDANAFIDPGECRAFFQRSNAAFEAELDKQSAASKR